MMKSLYLAIFAGLFSSPVFAAKTVPLMEITFESSSIRHQYALLPGEKGDQVQFTFRNASKGAQSKIIPTRQADYLLGKANRIAWASRYRKPANLKKCTPYLKMVIDGEKTEICREDRTAAARSYGFLNSLQRIFTARSN